MHLAFSAALDAPVDAVDRLRPGIYVEVAQALARAGFDFVLLRDSGGVTGNKESAPGRGREFTGPRLDAGILAPMMAVGAPGIGIVPEFEPLDYPPYILARLLGTLDHISKGRAGWAIPTQDADVERWSEFVQVMKGLIATWDRDAVVQDATQGLFADPAKVHYLNHEGPHYAVRGPLNVTPGPQAFPLVVQQWPAPTTDPRWWEHADVVIVRGSSGPELAARRAEVDAAAAARAPGSYRVLAAISVEVTFGGQDLLSTATPQGGLHLVGAGADVVQALTDLQDGSGVDGFVVEGGWDPAQVSMLTTRVAGLLRRRGQLSVSSPTQAPTLQETVLREEVVLSDPETSHPETSHIPVTV